MLMSTCSQRCVMVRLPDLARMRVAQAVAGEAGVPFYQMSGSEFVEAIVGVGAARVRDLFKRARVQEGPCIIFVDEIDALGTRRAQAGAALGTRAPTTPARILLLSLHACMSIHPCTRAPFTPS